MLSAHQTEHLGPKSQVSELVHFEHDINSGAVDSVARRIEAYAVGEHAGHAGFPLPKQADSISASGTATFPVQSARLHCDLDTTAARLSCRSFSHASRVQHRIIGTQDHTTSLRHFLPRGRIDKDSLTRSALNNRIGGMSDWKQLLSSTAATGHLLDGSPASNLLWNCRTARSHSPTYRTHRTSRTQGTRRACRILFARAGRQHQCIGNCGSFRATGPASL